MLDFGFSEILLTSAIALVVLGPERLPKVARQVGNWMGRARAMARQLSEQLEREVSADELMKAQTRHLNAPLPNRIAPSQVITAPPAVAPTTEALSQTSHLPAIAPTSETPPQTAHPEYTPPSDVPDLHALPPEASPTPHTDPRTPPNE